MYLERGHEQLILELAKRPWFTRVWTLQEMLFARPGHIIAICVNIEIDYDWVHHWLLPVSTTLRLCTEPCPLNDMYLDTLYLHVTMCRAVLQNLIGRSLSIPDVPLMVMRSIITCESTKLEVKVFSVYGVLKQLGVPILEPNIQLTVGQA